MNRIADLKQLKSNKSYNNKGKNTLSTASISVSTKLSTKVRLSEIFEYMSMEYPLSDLSEFLEKETGGKFTQLTFREIIDRIYPDLSINDKIFLIKHLPLSKIGITPYSPLIFILYLFKYIESIIKEKIISPSLIFYDIAEKLKYSYGTTTIDYFKSFNLDPEKEITIDDFYLNLGNKMGLDEISNIILFKSIDYNKDDKIKIEDLILVIDSYRNDNLDEKSFSMDNSAKKNVKLLKNFLEKNFLSLDLIYENVYYNYMTFNELKSFLVNEIYNYKRFTNYNDPQINETIVDNVLSVIKRENKIFKNDLKNYLGEFTFEANENDNENNRNSNIIKLNYKQKYWINKYLDLINSVKSTPKMIFQLAAKEPNINVVNIIDLLKQIVRLSPNGKLSSDEMKELINSLDINDTGLIEYNQYEIILNQIQDTKDKIKYKLEKQESQSMYNKIEETFNEKIINMWSRGVKSPYYHLLPVKGNYEVLQQINKDIKKNLIYDDKESNNNIPISKKKKIGKKIKLNNYLEEEKNMGDEGAIFEQIDKDTGKIEKYYTNDKNLMSEKVEILEEYNEEIQLRNALENFNFEKIYFSDNDLLMHLEQNKIAKNTCEEIVKYIDNNDDGLISVMDLYKFLLYELKYKSVKLVLKYLNIKIYKELNLKSSFKFFKANKFNILKKINVDKLSKFFEQIYIDTPLTKKLYDTLKNLFRPPFLYIHLCQLIDDYENESIYSKDKNGNSNLILSFNIDNLEHEMKNIIRNLLDVKDYEGDDTLKCKNLNDRIKDILIDNSENMNYTQFVDSFGKKLKISPSSTDGIFHLLKHKSPKGEPQQLISKGDLIMFLETFCFENDKSNLIFNFNKKNTENDEGLSLSAIKDIIENIEQNGPPLKYSFEKIPFLTDGYISCVEIVNCIDNFYNHSIPKKELMTIISCIDINKTGIIDYTQLQIFLNNFSDKEKFSPLLEIEIIATNLYKKNYIKSEKYFKKSKKLKHKEIKKKHHNSLLSDLCSNKNNMEKLYNYFINITKKDSYDLKLLTNKIDNLLENALYINRNNNNENNNVYEEEDLGFPDKIIIENALKLINLGDKGSVSMNELLLKMKKGYRKNLSEKIDKKHEGYISFPKFIKKLRKIYGTDINLNYKLCAEYLYKAYIMSPDKVKNYLLQKSGKTNINTYLNKKEVYNNFMFAFCNDKFLFESFYFVYQEKKGKYKNKLNLNSFLLFIYSNNEELKSLERSLRFNGNNNKEQIDSTNNKLLIINILEKKLTNVREIIEKINIKSSKLQKNFSISENYFNILLKTHFNFNDDDSEKICDYFRLEEGKFDLKKFYEFDPNNERNRNIIIQEDIIPRIQAHISKSIYKSYKDYKNNYFKTDFLDICELYNIFNKLYNTTLYQCILIIIGYKEQYLSIEAFFKDNNLKNIFPSKEFDPTLKLAIIRLNEYIEENYKGKPQDKLKIFKGYDTNKDGILSPEEFITALNSLKGINLNDNQKYKLYNFADSNKDGKINAKEFLELIKTIKNYINEEAELNAPLPANSVNYDDNNKYIPKILKIDISAIKLNYKFNKNKIKNLKNEFLSNIVKLQGDLIDNYYNNECMENDFLTADKKKEGYVNVNTFKIILQKRLFSVDDKIYNLFIKLSNDEEDDDDESLDIKNKKINYKIFLNRLGSYKFKDKKRDEEEQLPKIK